MKWIKSYKTFSESIQIDSTLMTIDLSESLGIFYENILKSIGAKEVDFWETLNLKKKDFSNEADLDLESLNNNTKFIKALLAKELKKSSVQNTEDSDTFINKPCRFIMIHKKDAFELENPEFIMIQSWNETLSKWDESKLYQVNGDIKRFYDKLSSKVIEIEFEGNNYIYQSTNKNEWILQNDEANDTFKKYLRKDELETLIKDNKVKIKII
jgi:hypothetical protein